MQILGLQIGLSFLAYGAIARWYVVPWLSSVTPARALVALLLVHVFRHLGLVFLVPDVAGDAVPPGFSLPLAYGDLLSAMLAWVAIAGWQMRARWASAATWVFNVIGALDLLIAYAQGVVRQPHIGAAWYIPTFVVPALLVSHALIGWVQTRPEART